MAIERLTEENKTVEGMNELTEAQELTAEQIIGAAKR
jgi:hypothetical protein